MEEKIKAIMADVFKIDVNDIDEDTSFDNVDQWTSIEHVEFVLNLEREFELELTDSQIVEELLSFRTIVQAVKAAIKAKSNQRAE